MTRVSLMKLLLTVRPRDRCVSDELEASVDWTEWNDQFLLAGCQGQRQCGRGVEWTRCEIWQAAWVMVMVEMDRITACVERVHRNRRRAVWAPASAAQAPQAAQQPSEIPNRTWNSNTATGRRNFKRSI